MSHLLTLHLPLDPARGDFAGDVLAERLRGVEVLDVQAFLHQYGGAPALAVVVQCEGERPSARRRQPTDWRARLASTDVPLFEELRRWRNLTAAQEGVRPFRVVTNRALAGVAALRPRSAIELETVPGVGPWTMEHYGEALLAQVAKWEDPNPTSDGTPRTPPPASSLPAAPLRGRSSENHGKPSGEVPTAPFGGAGPGQP